MPPLGIGWCEEVTIRSFVKTSHHESIWGSEDIAPPFLTLTVDRGEWSASRPGRFTPKEKLMVPNGQEAVIGFRYNINK
jgi:hypothetical protein